MVREPARKGRNQSREDSESSRETEEWKKMERKRELKEIPKEETSAV